MKKPVKISSNLSQISLLIHPQRKRIEDEPLIGAQATGFLWLQDRTYYLITNWHNVTGWDLVNKRALSDNGFAPDSLRFRLLKVEKGPEKVRLLANKYLTVDLYDADGRPSWLEHPEFGNRVDVVAISIGEAGEWVLGNDPVNKVGDLVDFEVMVGDDVFVLGFPLGLHGGGPFPIWKRASIASEPEIDLDGLPKLLIDTATRKGMSGSPVIAVRRGLTNPRGTSGFSDATIIGMAETFLGIYSGRVDDDPLGAQIGIVWKASVVEEIISAGVTGKTPFE